MFGSTGKLNIVYIVIFRQRPTKSWTDRTENIRGSWPHGPVDVAHLGGRCIALSNLPTDSLYSR
jgi:hypothetical protein